MRRREQRRDAGEPAGEGTQPHLRRPLRPGDERIERLADVVDQRIPPVFGELVIVEHPLAHRGRQHAVVDRVLRVERCDVDGRQ